MGFFLRFFILFRAQERQRRNRVRGRCRRRSSALGFCAADAGLYQSFREREVNGMDSDQSPRKQKRVSEEGPEIPCRSSMQAYP